jgi:hypothetical protein
MQLYYLSLNSSFFKTCMYVEKKTGKGFFFLIMCPFVLPSAQMSLQTGRDPK